MNTVTIHGEEVSDRPTFVLYINTENAAFDELPACQVAKLLRETAARLLAGEDYSTFKTLYDYNGNECGQAAFKLGGRAVTP